MKSVSFFRNTLWKRDTKDGDYKHGVPKGRDMSSQLSTSQSQSSKLGECIPKPPLLTFAVGPSSLQEGLDMWLQNPPQDSKSIYRQAKDRKQSSTDFTPVQPQSRPSRQDVTPPNHAGPLNQRHGPPHNVVHGPPGLSLPLSVESEGSAHSSSSLRRAHRPPKIKVYPSSYKLCEAVPHSPPLKPRSPARVKFAVPSNSSLSSASPPSLSTLKKNKDANPDIAVTQHIDDGTVCKCGVSTQSGPCNHSYQVLVDEDMFSPQGGRYSSPTVPAVLEPLPRSQKLYRDTGSSPHLPYLEARFSQSKIFAKSAHSTSMSDLADSDDPISLFPSPPPLVIRKKVPQPLVLRPTPTVAPLPPSPCFSSYDSTPPATPTTPRHQPSSRLSTKTSSKYITSRSSGNIPPPLFSPPTSPLPPPPSTSPGNVKGVQGTRPLRITKSTSHLRNEIYCVGPNHRFTSSEPISELSSDPIKVRKRADSRPVIQSLGKKPHEPSSLRRTPAASEPPVQWGYAF